MKAIKILFLCLLLSAGAGAQPAYLTDWFSYINTTLINGPANGGTKLYVGRAFDSVAAQAQRYASHKADSAALNDTAFAIRASIVAAAPTDTAGLSARINLKLNIADTLNKWQYRMGFLPYTKPEVNDIANLRKLGSDSTGATGFAPQYQIDTIKANLRASIAAGAADSVIYATMHRLDTVKANLRAQIAAGTADSTVFATIFRLDTAKRNLLAYIATKVTSVSGTSGQIASTGGATPVLSLATAGTAGTYGSSTQVNVITTDAYGRITAVTPTAITGFQPTGNYMTYSDTTISAAYTLTSRDLFRSIHCTNGSNIALTIPTGLGTTFRCEVIQEGAGTVTPTASSTTLNFHPTATTKTNGTGAAIIIRSWVTANTYTVQGDLQP